MYTLLNILIEVVITAIFNHHWSSVVAILKDN